MWGRRLDLEITLMLLLVLAATALSGLFVDYLGVQRSLYHRLSAYLLTALASWHIFLRRRQLWSRCKTALRTRRGAVAPPAHAESRPRRQPKRLALSRRGFLLSGAAAIAGFALGQWRLPGQLPPGLEGADFGLVYHQWSKPSLWGLVRRPFQWGGQPPLYKVYSFAKRTALPGAVDHRGLSVEEAIQRRRSIRDYSGKPLTMEQLSLLLSSAYGITEPSGPLRASPSAGTLYLVEIYPVVSRVDGLPSGVYHYRPKDHSLDMIKEGGFSFSLLNYTGGQDMVLQAGVVLVLAGIFQRTRWKYHDRAYRYVLLDVGHLGENLYLAATSLGLGPCGIGAFLDDEVNQLVGIDGKEEAAVYLLSIGSPA